MNVDFVFREYLWSGLGLPLTNFELRKMFWLSASVAADHAITATQQCKCKTKCGRSSSAETLAMPAVFAVGNSCSPKCANNFSHCQETCQ